MCPRTFTINPDSELRGLQAQRRVDVLEKERDEARAVAARVSQALGFTGPMERLHDAVESALDLSRKTLAEYQRATRERDAAVADNAALLDTLRWARAVIDDVTATPGFRMGAGMGVELVINQPHPGSALLERVRRLEKALRPLSGAVRHMRAYAMNKPFRLQIAADLDGRVYMAEATDQEVVAIIEAVDH